MKVSGVYKITNTATGDFYIGSSKNVKRRWKDHKCPSTWNERPNNPMYQDMKRYGLDYFVFEILEEVEPKQLKETEQQFIETLKPTYNSNRANGFDVERRKKYRKEYNKSEKSKMSNKKSRNKYRNQLCSYNGEDLTLSALSQRFRKAGIEHYVLEAKKYLVKKIRL